jgi:hypothetical protein
VVEVLRKVVVEVLRKVVLWMRLAGWVQDAELLLKRRGDVIWDVTWDLTWEAKTLEEEEQEEDAELLLKRT